MHEVTLLLILIAVVVIICYNRQEKPENFGSALMGTFNQLQARDPQDEYLMGQTEKYWGFSPELYRTKYPYTKFPILGTYPYDPFNPYIRYYDL